MEVAGLVVGVLPIAVTALQCYEACRGWSSSIRMRKSHVRTFARSLQGYEASLQLDLKIILKSIDGETEWDADAVRDALLNHDILNSIREYLGEHADAFIQTLEDVYEILDVLTRSIEGLLDTSSGQAPQDSLKKVALAQKHEIKIKFQGGIKLALRKREIDEYVRRLEKATNIISKIQNSTTTVRSMAPNRSSASKYAKLVKSLSRVSDHATRLHGAISSIWRPDCHPSHETKLYLEDRLDNSDRKLSAGSSAPVRFNVIFTSESAPVDSIWYESIVEILPNDHEEHSEATRSESKRTIKVKFTEPAEESHVHAHQNLVKIQDMCEEVTRARREQRQLRLLLRNSCELCYSESKQTIYMMPSQTVTLHDLLRSEKRMRSILSIRASLKLALVLASGLVQLHATPWFNKFWAKDGIYFLRDWKKSTEIDITQPLTFSSFGGHAITSTTASQEPREVLLGFGITLLELWRGITLEEKFPTCQAQLRGGYYQRMTLAWQWLEESQEHLLDYQSQAIEFCVKPLFANSEKRVTWDSDAFLLGLAENVIAPLHRAVKPKVTH